MPRSRSTPHSCATAPSSASRKGATIERPIHLVFAATGEQPASVFTRSLVVIEPGARAMLVESHEGVAGSTIRSTPRLRLVVGDEAHVDHIKITREARTRRCMFRR